MTAPTPLLSDHDATVRQRLAAAAPEADLDAAWAAYQDARIAGLCHEGAWEVALGARTESAPPSPTDLRP